MFAITLHNIYQNNQVTTRSRTVGWTIGFIRKHTSH